MASRVKFKRSGEKASAQELHFPLIVRIRNLVRRLRSSTRCAGDRKEQVLVCRSQDVDKALPAGLLGQQLEEILPFIEGEDVKSAVNFHKIYSRLERVGE